MTNEHKLSELLLLSIELEQAKREIEKDLERIKQQRAKIRATLAKYDIKYEQEMIFI